MGARKSRGRRPSGLTTTLRRLERNGTVARILVSSRPVAVEYRIAPLGKSLQDLVDALFQWTDVNMPGVERARERFDDEADEA